MSLAFICVSIQHFCLFISLSIYLQSDDTASGSSAASVSQTLLRLHVWWIMETLKRPACTVGWVARLCRSWLSPGKATRIFHGSSPSGTIQVLRNKNNNYVIVDAADIMGECVC